MTFSGAMEDRLLIRELYGAYSDATSRADGDAWLALWTVDGVRTQDGRDVTGHEELRKFWSMIFTAVERMAFFTELGSVDVTDDRAVARCYCREIVTLKSGELIKVVGIYDDQLSRVDGAWRFARRDYQVFINEGSRSPT